MSQVISNNGRRTPLSLNQGPGGNSKKNKNKLQQNAPIVEIVEPQVNPVKEKEAAAAPVVVVIEEKPEKSSKKEEKHSKKSDKNDSPVKPVRESPKTSPEEKTNGAHKSETNGNSNTEAKIIVEEQKVDEEKEKKVKESPRHSPRVTPKKAEAASIDLTGEEEKPLVLPETPKSSTMQDSIMMEKELKGFTAEGDEMMESLIVEPNEYEDSPMPAKAGKGKLLKLSTGPPARARISPFRKSERLTQENVSAIVNLSTVSEQTTTDSSPVVANFDFGQPLTSISGRRSTRTMKDIDYTYRKSAAYLNDSISSMNVTVGSEIHNDSLRTPIVGSARKRKDMTPESTSDVIVVESPKRARLDLSGFLGTLVSPVTMLKNRFSRVRLQSSTPNKLSDKLVDNSDACVTAEATTTTNISGDSENKMEIESAADTDAIGAHEAVEEIAADKKHENVDLTAGADAEKPEADDASCDVKQVPDKTRQWCNIM